MSDLDQQLHDLARRVRLPATDPDADLARGRRRLVRRRTLAAASAAVVAVVVLGVSGLVQPGQLVSVDDDLAGGDDRPVPSREADPRPTTPEPSPSDVAPSELPFREGRGGAGTGAFDFSLPTRDSPEGRQRLAVRQAVQRDLDPGGAHVTDAEVRLTGGSGSTIGDDLFSIVEKVGWTNPGESGLGEVQVEVARGRDELLDCGGSPARRTVCRDVDLDGVAAFVVTGRQGPGTTTWVHEREDGYVTSVTLNTLYGNNSLTGVSGIDVTAAQLGDLLADPALDLPGHPPATPPDLPGSRLRDVARAVLATRPGDLTGETWSGDAGSFYDADYAEGGQALAEVMLEAWDAPPAVEAPCDPDYASSCTLRVVDGVRVRVDVRLPTTGGGYDVMAAGATRTIWLHVDPADGVRGSPVPVDDAVRLVTDPRLQAPGR